MVVWIATVTVKPSSIKLSQTSVSNANLMMFTLCQFYFSEGEALHMIPQVIHLSPMIFIRVMIMQLGVLIMLTLLMAKMLLIILLFLGLLPSLKVVNIFELSRSSYPIHPIDVSVPF